MTALVEWLNRPGEGVRVIAWVAVTAVMWFLYSLASDVFRRRHRDKHPTRLPPRPALSVSPPQKIFWSQQQDPTTWPDAASARLMRGLCGEGQPRMTHSEYNRRLAAELAKLVARQKRYGQITTPPLTGTSDEIIDQLWAETSGYPRRSTS